jgi:ubiquinone/menaquinone biosynthesis C-methylase UbiE
MTIYRQPINEDESLAGSGRGVWHEANRRGWEAVSPGWQAGIDAQGLWRRCPSEPELVLRPEELAVLGDLRGRPACVLGSGDNQVAFALAGLGAQVTSVDITQMQLDIAAGRAKELGLEMRFVRADVTDLRALPDAAFDVVYTGGHVAVWVSDLWCYYAEAARILKRGGLFMVNEYHPFRRIWDFDSEKLEMEYGYYDRGPHAYDRSEEVAGAEPGSYPSYEFHWTVSDYVTAMLDAGCSLVALRELGNQRQGWETRDLTGLPEDLLIVGRKA